MTESPVYGGGSCKWCTVPAVLVAAAQLISTIPLKKYQINDEVAQGGRLEELSSCRIMSLIPEIEASREYKPCDPSKIFRRAVQDCTLSLFYFYKTYSLLVILPRLTCT